MSRIRPSGCRGQISIGSEPAWTSFRPFLLIMKLQLKRSIIRTPRAEDAPALAKYANNRKVWRNLRDFMPHPYSLADAEAFIERALADERPTMFVIQVAGEAAGSMGLVLKQDIERIGAELGYWLAEPYWGQGILSEAVPAFTEWAMREFGLLRLEAIVFEWNPASARVLEKAGYVREGTLRRSAVKDGQVIDRWVYRYLAEAASEGPVNA
jgi:RimJ/RimL family protein N-acetyltransferase